MKCSYCGGIKFYEGPTGGMSRNLLCANPRCRHWFNYTPVIDRLDDLHRVELVERVERWPTKLARWWKRIRG